MSEKLIQTVSDKLPSASEKVVIRSHLPQFVINRNRLLRKRTRSLLVNNVRQVETWFLIAYFPICSSTNERKIADVIDLGRR